VLAGREAGVSRLSGTSAHFKPAAVFPTVRSRDRAGKASQRALDLVVSLAAGLLALPLLALVALAVWAAMGRPILFRQQRPGLDGKPFWMLKFRTMVEDGVGAGPGQDHLRLTRLGRWLRDCSLDELPQIWNVLSGEMSLVGPRPQLMQYLDRFSLYHQRRHEVLPGITGLAQVSGRNGIPWETRLDLDVWYVDHRSFWLDLKILARTIPMVLSARGVRAPRLATMSEYLGPRESADLLVSAAGLEPAGEPEGETAVPASLTRKIHRGSRSPTGV
jgi:lipopolysaccharide/colanic/teichoic acid biosynthesis glycosyltransferase